MFQWLTNSFIHVLFMSVSAGWTILFVIVIRLLLSRIPKRIIYPLWAVVIFRLCCPFSLQSLYSLFPSVLTTPARIIQAPLSEPGTDLLLDNEILSPSLTMAASNLSNKWNWMLFFAVIWAAGMCVLLLYGGIQTWKFSRQLRSLESVKINDIPIPVSYLPAGVHSTFLFGLCCPRIYLPKGLSSKETEYILTHELSHLRRGDHIVKPFFWILVCVHWINPFVWLAFYLFESDVERSCDERVLLRMISGSHSGKSLSEIKKEYASVLLQMSSKRRFAAGYPLALGENSVKGRIQGILQYKKTKLWVSVLAAATVAAVGIGLALNPASEGAAQTQHSIDFTTNDGKVFSVDLSLPNNLSLDREDATDSALSSFVITYQKETVGSLRIYPFATDNAEDLQSVDTSSENLPMQIYATIALSGYVDYQNGYEVVLSTNTLCSAVCRPLIHEIENYAGNTPDAPWSEHDCVLAYDLAGKPYFLVLFFDADIISPQQLKEVAKSVSFL